MTATNTGHSFRFKERKYQQWAVKLQELIDELEPDIDGRDPFENALWETLLKQVTNCELAASIEFENYNDKN